MLAKEILSESVAGRMRHWAAKHPLFAIAFVILLVEGPFLNKAIHIDDTLFVLTAEQILKHPGDFYGFDVNWTGYTVPMSVENCNPPAVSYFLAGIITIFGIREIPLHVSMFLFTFAAAAGLFHIARSWCERPLLATILAISSPVFLVSGTTLMCDMPMLALWAWSLVFWDRALQQGRVTDFLLAGVLGGVAVLTKYSALTLLPLLPLISLPRKRKLGWWFLWLAVPAIIILTYEYGTSRLYGTGLIAAASSYAAQTRFAAAGGWFHKLIIGLAFLGACLLPVLMFAHRLWTKRQLYYGGGLIFAAALVILSLAALGADFGWFFRVQMALMFTAGVHVFLAAVFELWRRRDAITFLLAAWIGSGFVFSAIFNWTVSARSFLPLVPPAMILLMRYLDRAIPESEHERWAVWPLGLSFVVSLLVSEVDYQLANSGRTAAKYLAGQYNRGSAPIWFQGHRGFQYYLERAGARPVDFSASILKPGELMVVPSNGNTLVWPDDRDAQTVATFDFGIWSWLSTVNAATGAGFYGAGGFLPFVVGRAPEERYFVCRISRTMSFAPPEILNNMAWRLATSPDPTVRDGKTAVELAQRACEMTAFSKTILVGTLAAAYAEAGQFEAAITTAESACNLAAKNGETNLFLRNCELAALYRAKQPFHEQKRP